jgi:hypothetical protein
MIMPLPSDRRLALLAELEASLRATLEAVLARNLSCLGQLTDQQASLCWELSLLKAPSTGAHDKDKRVHCACARVLHLGRVQSALLRRAQQSLRTASNLLAGRQAAYGPVPGCRAIALQTVLPPKET